MNANLTPKQEAFALAVARGMTQSDAYRGAYEAGKCSDKRVHEMASEVMSNPKVSQRICDLRTKLISKVAQEIAYEYRDAMRELDEAIAFAKEFKSPGAFVAALNLKQKISGLQVMERKNDRSPVGDWSHERVKAALEALQAIKRAKQSKP